MNRHQEAQHLHALEQLLLQKVYALRRQRVLATDAAIVFKLDYELKDLDEQLVAVRTQLKELPARPEADSPKSLTGDMFGAIVQSLTTAFDIHGLRQCVRIHLDETLELVAGGENQSAVVFSLVQWAERHDRILDLLEGAAQDNPDHPYLSSVLQQYRASLA